MLHPKTVAPTALALLALAAAGCVAERPEQRPEQQLPETAGDVAAPVATGREPSVAPAPAPAPARAPAPEVDLFASLGLELEASWREGDAVVLLVQEERDEAATEVLSGFEGWIAGGDVILTPRYTEGVSGLRRRFRTRLDGDELPDDWRERVYLVVASDLTPLPSGAVPDATMPRRRIVLGARVLR